MDSKILLRQYRKGAHENASILNVNIRKADKKKLHVLRRCNEVKNHL